MLLCQPDIAVRPDLPGRMAGQLHEIAIEMRLIGIAAFRCDCGERHLRLPVHQSGGVLHPDGFAEQLGRIADGFSAKVVDIAGAVAGSLRKLRNGALSVGAEDAFRAIAEQILLGILLQTMRLQETNQKFVAFREIWREKKAPPQKDCFRGKFPPGESGDSGRGRYFPDVGRRWRRAESESPAKPPRFQMQIAWAHPRKPRKIPVSYSCLPTRKHRS